MKSSTESILQFAGSAQRRLIIVRIIEQVVLYLGGLSAIASFLNVLFIFLPFSFIIYLFDATIVFPFFVAVFFCIMFILIKRISRLDALKYLEKQSRIQHGIVSIAYEMRNDTESVFKKRTMEAAFLQIQTLKKFFPSYCKGSAFIVFIVGMILLIGTSLLQNSAFHHMAILEVLNNNKIIYVVKPGTIAIPKGKNVILIMECKNSLSPSCWLITKDISSGKTVRKLIYKNSRNMFADTLVNVTKSLQYQFVTANKKINRDSINVIQPPVIQSIALKIINPEYMNRLDTVIINGNGNVSGYRGSTIEVEIESSFLKSALIVAGKDTIGMKIKNCKASGTISVLSNENMHYSIILNDTIGQKNENQIEYEITILPDEQPVVQITEPAFNKNLTPGMSEKIAFEAFDDFGISKADLFYFMSSNPNKISSVKLSPKYVMTKYQNEYNWDLGTTGLYPGDTLYYFVKVSDNYPYKPFHSACSDTFFFRVPSFEEISKGIYENEKHAEQLLKKAVDNNAEIRKTTEKIESESKRSSENPSWEQIQLLDEVKEQVEGQRDSLQKAVDELNQSAEKLRKQGELGKELADKMEQIEKMIARLTEKYGDSLFTKPDESQKISSKQLKEAVEKAKELLPDLEEALDNTLKYLEAMKKDREIAELSMKAEYLARQQLSLNEKETAENDVQQEQVVKESQDLNSDIRKKPELSSDETIDSLLKRIDTIGKELKTRKKMSSSSDKKASTAMSQSLMSLSDELREMMSDAQMNKSEKEMKKVLGIAGMLLTVSDWIEALDNKQLDDKTVGEHLQVFSDALRKVQSSIDSLEIIPPEMLGYMAKHVTLALNELRQIMSGFDSFQVKRLDTVSTSLLVLSNDLLTFVSQASQQQNSCNGGGGSGMMSKMRKLSQRQSGVNSVTSAMLRALMDGKQGTLPGRSGTSPDDKRLADAAQKAAMERQKEIADELSELQKEYANDNANAQMVKRLDELKKEAQRLTDMFAEPSSMLEEKQNVFLNRMLQSALSVNRQDEKKEERKSESAKTLYSEQRSTKLLGPSSPDAFYLMKRKALQGNFPESYRSSINAYLDSLGVLYLKEK
jgi:hypothetical protein